jgi:4-aminobutyrate aminotransferase
VLCFEDGFHGRTLLAMSLTSKVHPYKAGFGPFAPEVYRAPAPYPYHGISSDDAIAALEHLFKADVDPSTVACVVLEPVQGEGGFVEMPRDYLLRLQELCRSHGILYVDDEVQSGVGRTGTMWAVDHYDGVEPDLVTFGKSIGGGLPLAGVTGKAEVMDAVPPGGLGGTFGGNPVCCAAGIAVLDILAAPGFLEGATKLGERLRARLDAMAASHPEIGEVRGLGAMLAFEFAERTPDRAQAVVAAAAERGLLLLSCGLYGNVIRLLPALNIAADDLDEGLAILEESLGV